MKKVNRKLGLHSEIIRTLDNTDLKRARGGDDAARPTDGTQSGINCVAQAAVVVPK